MWHVSANEKILCKMHFSKSMLSLIHVVCLNDISTNYEKNDFKVSMQ